MDRRRHHHRHDHHRRGPAELRRRLHPRATDGLGGGSAAARSRAVIALLAERTAEQAWWLGYLDTGTADVVFPDAPRVSLYSDWRYVLAEAGPRQAATWRRSDDGASWKGALPDLMFPADSSWLVSTLWDDDWTCIGGAEALVQSLLSHPDLGGRARRVALGQDATPPGHVAR